MMTGKIFRSITIVSFTALISCFLFLLGVLYTYFGNIERERLKSELGLAAHAANTYGTDCFGVFSIDDYRLTLISSNGDVVYDSDRSIYTLDNHSNREEIIEAKLNGYGDSTRFSDSLTENTMYYAVRLNDGNVLRISEPIDNLKLMILNSLWPLISVFMMSMIIALVFANRLSKSIMKPINVINLNSPLENDTYEELTPLLTQIDRQQKKIRLQRRELSNRKREFYAVLKNMNEGIVLLNSNASVISINPSAQSFFNSIDCIGKKLDEIESDQSVHRAFAEAMDRGNSYIQINRNGKEYQINFSSIDDNKKLTGMVILIFDITDKVFAERNRKEFTANVTHELKTPLQSIMGSAELLENGLVKAEDVDLFTGRIHFESARLVSLIDDIIHLSQLDEGNNLEFENIDLYQLSVEELERINIYAEKRNISVELIGEPQFVNGSRQILHEIVYNLCENAVKYNKSNGKVEVIVGRAGSSPFITVKDTGIGIAPEHQERVFERFYRVDKSRSKETGGTGLGLSIVKHAAQYMNASIKLESELGVGTAVTITF